tara:strand:+ start:2271 stop:3188 length:918 start_codon:yes stop_codon:yes gene_type:complete
MDNKTYLTKPKKTKKKLKIKLKTSNVEKTSVIKMIEYGMPKDESRLYCKTCGEYGHKNELSNSCHIKIFYQNIIKTIIRQEILNTPISCDIEPILEKISNNLKISIPCIKKLYQDIDPVILLNRKIKLDKLKDELEIVRCFECNKKIIKSHSNTIRIWKDKDLCDKCWCKFENIRDNLWDKVIQYKKLECVICGDIKQHTGQRFHYDHVNMFKKDDSICCMINRGDEIEKIYKEIDKCQVLCKTCHDLVTHIESLTGFIRIKSNLTRDYNNEKFTEEEYENKKTNLQKLYDVKMKEIYESIKDII